MNTQSFDLAFLGDDDDFDPVGQEKVESLVDGEYEFAIRDSKFKVLAGKNMAILEMHLEVLSAGKHSGGKVQHALYIKDADSRNRVGKDLATLGFDCDKWTKENGRPFSQEIPKAPNGLKGLRFFAKKVTNKKDGKEYHNLYINKRSRSDGKPTIIGPEQLNAADVESDDPF